MDRLRNIRLASRTIFWLLFIGLNVAVLYVFDSPRFVQIICGGGLVLLFIVGVLLERGMAKKV